MGSSARDDWYLLNAARRDADALAELFRRHKDRVFRVAWSLVGPQGGADDVTQDVFERLAKNRRKHKATAAFTTWLHQVTVNAARDWMRKQARHVATDNPEAIESLASQPSIDPMLRDLGTAMQDLTERQREVVVLRVLEGYSTEETARLAGCSTGTVKTHLHRALSHVKTLLS